MRLSPRHLLPAAIAALALAAPAAAAAETTATTTAPETPPATSVPAGGSMRLATVKVGGKPLFAIVGSSILIRGTVTPFVEGQTVKASVYLGGRKVLVRVIPLAPAAGAGRFELRFRSPGAGVVQVRAAHYATAQQAAFSAIAPSVDFVNPGIGPGSRGQSVRLLQSELDALHYAVPLNGSFEEGTGRALIAYRKMTGLERVAAAGRRVFELLERGAGAYRVRFPGDGRHIEANLTKQVLVEIERGGRVRSIYTMSSGKPSTPTVLGRFRVYRKEPGINSHGMVDSSYFISGYAIHGYFEVPVYAASHGCLRVPIPDAPAIYAWVSFGMPVDVFN